VKGGKRRTITQERRERTYLRKRVLRQKERGNFSREKKGGKESECERGRWGQEGERIFFCLAMQHLLKKDGVRSQFGDENKEGKGVASCGRAKENRKTLGKTRRVEKGRNLISVSKKRDWEKEKGRR